MKDAHDPRCERSGTDPKRCQCDCNGSRHGIGLRREAEDALGRAYDRGVITADEYRIAIMRLEP